MISTAISVDSSPGTPATPTGSTTNKKTIRAGLLCILIFLALSCGLGDMGVFDLRVTGLASLIAGTNGRLLPSEIKDVEPVTMAASPLPQVVKETQRVSMFGGYNNYRTFLVDGPDAFFQPLYAYRRGSYVGVRVFVENRSVEDLRIDWSSCVMRIPKSKIPLLTERNDNGDVRTLEPLAVGFDGSRDKYLIADNGEKHGEASYRGRSYSFGEMPPYSLIGCEPADENKLVDILLESEHLDLPQGRAAVVTFCFSISPPSQFEFDFVYQKLSSKELSGYRVSVQR